MINIIDKHNCCGCEACVQACPKQCISFNEDTEGFRYPEVDKSLCVNCGVCEKVCPILTPYESHRPQKQYAAINPDEAIREQSSSGGIFTMLAERVICEGGCVFGVRFDDNWQAVFDHTDTIEGLAAFRGSKYVQARVGQAFKEVRGFLKQNRKVLFSGTPCQVAALRHFLLRDYDNLLLVDFICHGVPSPKVWRMYLDEVTQNAIRAISDVQFRNKIQGWKRYNFDITYDCRSHQYKLSSWYQKNHYMRIFLNDVSLRPSCYNCKAKAGRSGSDLTIADFWGIGQLKPDMDDDHGTSLVLVHTEKGANHFSGLQLKPCETKYEDILLYNPALERCAMGHPKRKWFFSLLDSSDNLVSLIDNTLCTPSFSCIMRLKVFINKVLYSIRMLCGQEQIDISSNTDVIVLPPYQLLNPTKSAVNFRSKQHGWKKYEFFLCIESQL